MPNIKSTVRRVKRSKKQALINRIRKSKYKSAVKKMMAYVDGGKMENAKKFLPSFHSQVMKIAKTGSVNKKTVSRKISRITKKINKSQKK